MIIDTLLDTDLYKLTMMQAVLHQFPGAEVKYEFKCRTEGVDFTPVVDAVREEIHHLCTLGFSEDELKYCATLPFFKRDFVHFLRIFRLQKRFVEVGCENGELRIEIKGPWVHTILFEVPVLAIVNEAYFRHAVPKADLSEARTRLANKIEVARSAKLSTGRFVFADFGTRRRFSREWHDELVQTLAQELPGKFVGTSNVYLAQKHGLKPIGTMAHEWLMAAQALGPRLADSQKFALERWVKEYRGLLGLALSDVVGFAAFLRDFDLYFAKLFDGCRHDSGDPFVWGEKLIAHYRDLGIDAATKTAIFSDGLNMYTALDLATRFEGRIRTSFGIGTDLTNDTGIPALQIVIKMVACNGMPVAKLSDSSGKQMCKDENYLRCLANVFQREDCV